VRILHPQLKRERSLLANFGLAGGNCSDISKPKMRAFPRFRIRGEQSLPPPEVAIAPILASRLWAIRNPFLAPMPGFAVTDRVTADVDGFSCTALRLSACLDRSNDGGVLDRWSH
jgi:hypothetical protein